ncbi:TPA: hypothetical protein U2L65_000689 [Citrobacter farmeri]|uniref:hypothetical protein n=1 Tax=Citrobacter farmeri TaxID=67824 RepID=UPI001E398961|nr:hypothetical protein [Citrobacter farmeri]GJL45247.1 hypothetical protein TUM17580_13060 [Citrobacter farmeri]HCD7255167.1 hypothetical protein [Citrobacter farmeri]HCD7631831.1 hypothetical protein [Citrobacter farmeri]HEM7970528.1 hypothetical protein [Citrobacter farmeri]HEM7983944.1 hypothetical protein [Citrobacter farmeri]
MMAPDMINGSKSYQAVIVDFETMPVGSLVLFNYKQKQKSGCGVGRSASGGLSFYTLSGHTLTSIGAVTADLSGKVKAIK